MAVASELARGVKCGRPSRGGPSNLLLCLSLQALSKLVDDLKLQLNCRDEAMLQVRGAGSRVGAGITRTSSGFPAGR